LTELEKDTLEKLIEYLKSHRYSDSSLAIEYNIGKYCFGLVVIDTETNIPMQEFEVKSMRDEMIKEFGKRQLEKYLKELKTNVPAYLVFSKQTELFF
jgi:hypothetical protein